MRKRLPEGVGSGKFMRHMGEWDYTGRPKEICS